MPEWLIENAFSIILLLVVAFVIALLSIKVFRGFKAAATSDTPQCFGCPSAKRCKGHCNCGNDKNK